MDDVDGSIMHFATGTDGLVKNFKVRVNEERGPKRERRARAGGGGEESMDMDMYEDAFDLDSRGIT